MNINYAYVRFISDDEKLIVPVNHIKKFGKYYPDEKENRKYNVKYTNGDYYPAQILCVAETLEDLQKVISEKRLKVKPSHFLQSASSGTEASEVELELDQRTKTNKPKSRPPDYTSSVYEQILNSIEVAEEDNTEDTQESETIMLLKCEIVQLKDLNYKLQHQVIDKWAEFSEKLENICRKIDNINVANPIAANHDRQIGDREDGRVYLGRNVYIPEHTYDSVWAQSKTNSIFVRDMATAIFGDQCLRASTVTGKQCNKTGGPPRPSLDPTKLMAIHDVLKLKLKNEGMADAEVQKEISKINGIISQKIIDLKRGPREIKGKKKEIVAEKDAGSAAVATSESDDSSASTDSDR